MSERFLTTVVEGKGRGRRIGFPTLNLKIPETLRSVHGIYAGNLSFNNKRYAAAIHFGPIPTFEEKEPTLEAFLLDTTLEDAPREVEIELVSLIRAIETFENKEELSARIAQDVSEVRRLLGI